MTRINWVKDSPLFYSSGVDRGMIYPKDLPAKPWNGLVSITAKDSGQNTVSYFLDGEKYTKQVSPGDYSASVTAYTYPEDLDSPGIIFGFSYRVKIETPDLEAYQIHLVYGARAEFGDLTRSSETSQTGIELFSLDLSTNPSSFQGTRPTAHLVIDSRNTRPWIMETIEDILYGSVVEDPRLPEISEVYEIFESQAILRITDHGDGTWTADGPDEAIVLVSPTLFEISWPSALYLDATTYTISTL